MTTTKSEVGAPQSKRTRTATVTYPYHPLELCIPIAETVKRIGNGRSDVSNSKLASSLGVSEQSADFAQKIASSKTFGLIHGKSTFLLTETAREFFFPTENAEISKKKSLLRFFDSPGAYHALIERYDGTIPPSMEIMGNVLHKEFGIPESWRLRVAAQFLRSAMTAGVMGNDGYLRFKATSQQMGIAASNASPKKMDAPQVVGDLELPKNPPEDRLQQDGIIVWTYPCAGKFLRVETPEKMTQEIWEKLNKYIQILQP